MPTGVNDRYANLANATVTGNGATIAFQELQTGISLGQGMGLLIDQIDYYFNATSMSVLADGENLILAWTVSNALSSIGIDQKGVIHSSRISRNDQGVAASGSLIAQPITFKFTPPIPVAAPRLYLAVGGVAGITQNQNSRFYYRYIKLSSQDYLELAEAFILVG